MCGEVFDGVEGVLVRLYVVGVLLEELLVGCFELVAGEPVFEVIPFGCVVSDCVVFFGEELVCFFIGGVFFCGVDSGESFEPDMIGVVTCHESAVEIE